MEPPPSAEQKQPLDGLRPGWDIFLTAQGHAALIVLYTTRQALLQALPAASSPSRASRQHCSWHCSEQLLVDIQQLWMWHLHSNTQQQYVVSLRALASTCKVNLGYTTSQSCLRPPLQTSAAIATTGRLPSLGTFTSLAAPINHFNIVGENPSKRQAWKPAEPGSTALVQCDTPLM